MAIFSVILVFPCCPSLCGHESLAQNLLDHEEIMCVAFALDPEALEAKVRQDRAQAWPAPSVSQLPCLEKGLHSVLRMTM